MPLDSHPTSGYPLEIGAKKTPETLGAYTENLKAIDQKLDFISDQTSSKVTIFLPEGVMNTVTTKINTLPTAANDNRVEISQEDGAIQEVQSSVREHLRIINRQTTAAEFERPDEVTVADLGSNVGGDIHPTTEEVRLNIRILTAANDDRPLIEQILNHEGGHKHLLAGFEVSILEGLNCFYCKYAFDDPVPEAYQAFYNDVVNRLERSPFSKHDLARAYKNGDIQAITMITGYQPNIAIAA